MRNNIIAGTLLTLFYGMMIYAFLGLNIWMIGISFVIIFFFNAICYLVLSNEISKEKQSNGDGIILYQAFVQIVLILMFIVYLFIFEPLFDMAISPLTGHILFIGSFVVQLLFLRDSYHLKWPKYALGAYAVAYITFAFYYIVPFGLLGLLFGYVVVQNIVVVTFGILRFMSKRKHSLIEEG